MNRVVGVERDAIRRRSGRPAVAFGALLDFYAIRVVGSHVMQSKQVRHHQSEQHQRHGNDVKTEEAVQCGVTYHVVTANEQGQIGSDKWNRGKQVHDHLRAPERHLSPRQQITHECFSHQA